MVFDLWSAYVSQFNLWQAGLRSKALGEARQIRRTQVKERTCQGLGRACLVWMLIKKVPEINSSYRRKESPAWYWKKDHPMLLTKDDDSVPWPTEELVHAMLYASGTTSPTPDLDVLVDVAVEVAEDDRKRLRFEEGFRDYLSEICESNIGRAGARPVRAREAPVRSLGVTCV